MPRHATSRTTGKTGQRKSAKDDALGLLIEDHKKVKKMFEEFEKLRDKADVDEDRKQLLVETTCAELTIHMQLEEELFYPPAHDAIEEDDLLDEAEVEHGVARQLITELAAMHPDDDLYNAKFTVLGEYIQHHIEEEEKELFPKIKKSDMELVELAAEMRERRMELRDELGFTAEDEQEEDAEATRAYRRDLH